MITIRNLRKAFYRGSVNEIQALDGVDLEIRPGDFVTLIGSNGAGKSTLLSAVAGTFFPDEGAILMDDADITPWPEHRRARFISRVFQDPLMGTCGSLTIEQNLAIAFRRGKRRGLGWGVRSHHRVFFQEELRNLGLGLDTRLSDPVGLLSGGQRQALTLLMATLVRPLVLLLDEHTAALDPKTAGQILALTREWVERQELTTLMVTHNMNQALRLGNRLVMIHRGKIILDVRDEEKAALTVEDLLGRFYEVQGEEFSADRMLLV
jgi:putative ABC transport system ATP-binding protein